MRCMLSAFGVAALLVGCNGEEIGDGGTGGAGGGGGPSGGAATAGRSSGGASATGGSGGCGGCGIGLTCCDGACVNPANDINNCGSCDNSCTGSNPYCDNGTCGTPPCQVTIDCADGFCCGTSCCASGELCCMIQMGPSALQCVAPVNGTCPVGCPGCVCAAPDTPISTPEGPRPIASLHAGDLVLSVDRGRVVAAPVLRTQRIPVTSRHAVVRATLSTGAVLEISAPHPTADGRRFGDLRAGDELGGIPIVELGVVAYEHGFTYDILPASDSGTYFAGGALVGSTLAAPPNLPLCVAAP